MGSLSKIAWTDATWNPTTGCDPVSPGCAHCYAMTMAKRLRAMGRKGYEDVVDDRGRWTGVVNTLDDRLDEPLGWKKPRMVFVDSMSDLFHEAISDEFIDHVFAVMALAPRHVFQVLTKRSKRMREYLSHPQREGRIAYIAGELTSLFGEKHGTMSLVEAWNARPDPNRVMPLPNVWLGVSVENNRYDSRIVDLVAAPAAVRFISFEPLLGAIFAPFEEAEEFFDRNESGDDGGYWHTGDCRGGCDFGCGGAFWSGAFPIHWAIVGCESLNGRVGRGCERPAAWHQWAYELVGECSRRKIPTFVKQVPVGGRVSHDVNEWPPSLRVRRWPAALPEIMRGQPA